MEFENAVEYSGDRIVKTDNNTLSEIEDILDAFADILDEQANTDREDVEDLTKLHDYIDNKDVDVSKVRELCNLMAAIRTSRN